jgi:small membrane protein
VAPVIIISLVLLALYAGTKRLSGWQILGVVALTVIGTVFVIFPWVSTRVANSLGVGRGTDLIFYLAVLAGLFIASGFYFRFKRHEQILIALTRQSAIDHAQEPHQGGEPAALRAQGDRPIQQVEDDLKRVQP